MSGTLRLGVIGAGLKAADYARSWVDMPELRFVAIADVSAASRQRLTDICIAAGRPAPQAFDDFRTMLATCRGDLDAVYVSTPHALHAEQAVTVVEAGLDLLLEKPMVMSVAEAERLIAAREASGATVVIAFQGALSPLVSDTRKQATAGKFGELVSIAATIWEDWSSRYCGHWKQQPALSGGGFMFDTGAHMMNTVCLLADADFERISAYMSNRGSAVDIVTAVAGRLANGALVTFNAAGEGPSGCASHITFFYTQAIVRIDAWGGWREVTDLRAADAARGGGDQGQPDEELPRHPSGEGGEPVDGRGRSAFRPAVGRCKGIRRPRWRADSSSGRHPMTFPFRNA